MLCFISFLTCVSVYMCCMSCVTITRMRQATLAALDALRKAHETEVQREICKFKDEFIKKMQPGIDLGKLQKEHV